MTETQTIHTFALLRTLGWAHTAGGDEVLCQLVTLRDSDMLIPGGVLIVGHVEYDDEGGGIPAMYRRLPIPAVAALAAALRTNDMEEDRIRAEEDWTPTRLSYLPASVAYQEGRDLYLVAFTESDAVAAAMAAGINVRPHHGYAGPGGDGPDGPYHGMVWRRLIERFEWSA